MRARPASIAATIEASTRRARTLSRYLKRLAASTTRGPACGAAVGRCRADQESSCASMRSNTMLSVAGIRQDRGAEVIAVRHVEHAARRHQHMLFFQQFERELLVVEIRQHIGAHFDEGIHRAAGGVSRRYLLRFTASITARRDSYRRPPGAVRSRMLW